MFAQWLMMCLLAAPGPVAGDPAPKEPAVPPAAPAAADAAAAPAAAPPKITLDVRPSSFQISQYVHFDDKGEVRSSQYNCSLSAQARYKAGVRVLAVKGIEVTRIVTDTGQVIPPAKGQREYHQDVARQAEPMFHLNLQLPPPPARAKGFSEITGKVTLTIGDGALRYATVGPWNKAINKNIRIEGFDAPLSVSIRRENENRRFRLEYPRNASAVLESVRAQDANGRDVRLDEQGGGTSDNIYMRYYSATVPDDGFLILAFYPKVQEIEVPFTIKDLALPKPPTNDTADLVVQATDKPLRPSAVKNAQPQLKVIVE